VYTIGIISKRHPALVIGRPYRFRFEAHTTPPVMFLWQRLAIRNASTNEGQLMMHDFFTITLGQLGSSRLGLDVG
jgi:hypothetical protein